MNQYLFLLVESWMRSVKQQSCLYEYHFLYHATAVCGSSVVYHDCGTAVAVISLNNLITFGNKTCFLTQCRAVKPPCHQILRIDRKEIMDDIISHDK